MLRPKKHILSSNGYKQRWMINLYRRLHLSLELGVTKWFIVPLNLSHLNWISNWHTPKCENLKPIFRWDIIVACGHMDNILYKILCGNIIWTTVMSKNKAYQFDCLKLGYWGFLVMKKAMELIHDSSLNIFSSHIHILVFYGIGHFQSRLVSTIIQWLTCNHALWTFKFSVYGLYKTSTGN